MENYMQNKELAREIKVLRADFDAIKWPSFFPQAIALRKWGFDLLAILDRIAGGDA